MPKSRHPVAVAVLAAAVLALAGCSWPGGDDPPPPTATTSEGDGAAPSPDETLPAGGATIAPPDLSGNEVDCTGVSEPCDYGDDPELDRLWDACAQGDGGACDRLYYDSAFDTRYEQFGNTCGDRDLVIPCPGTLP